jgi:hypothetical protein
MDDVRKQQERILVNYFLETCEDAPAGKLISGESPDFILRTSRKYAIGIELTEISEPGTADEMEVLVERLREALEKKEHKLALYRKKRLDKYWLVITAENLDGLDVVKAAEYFNRKAWSSDFHRIYLFDLFEGRLAVIKK